MGLKKVQQKVIEFRDARDWAKYHNPKDLAILFSLEASEPLEIFQWKDPQEVEATKGIQNVVGESNKNLVSFE